MGPVKRGRRGKQGVTRERLLHVTIDLMRRDGLQALTTARIAKEAGIAQPGFYTHFKNIDDCLKTAVTRVSETLRDRQSEARRRAFARFRKPEDLWNQELLRACFADTIEVILSEPRFAELFLCYRRASSLLDGYLKKLSDEVREEMLADLWRSARSLGAQAESYPQVAFWAEEVYALFLCGAEALLDGRYTDRAMIYDLLAQHTSDILKATSARAQPGSRLRR